MKNYQENFSSLHPEIYFDDVTRSKKAKKMLAIVRDFCGEDLSELQVLDVGCSTGAMCSLLANEFGAVTGIDIDENAVRYAEETHASHNVSFRVGDAMDTGFKAESFDVVICAHIYEHVPDPVRMMKEIFRILRSGGVCYFAAENKLVFREGDYGLPFLSVLPRGVANKYIRISGKAEFYYETLFTYWQLRKLVRDFVLIDYTTRAIEDPVRFQVAELVPPGSLKWRVAAFVVRHLYWVFPNYLWLLRKP